MYTIKKDMRFVLHILLLIKYTEAMMEPVELCNILTERHINDESMLVKQISNITPELYHNIRGKAINSIS